jgi:hypothetical protein
MPTTHKITYSTTNTAITITLANLSNAAARSSDYVDNSSNVYIDASVRVKVGTGVTTGTDNAVYVYGYGAEDTTNFGGWTSGTNAAILTTMSNMPLLGIVSTGLLPPFTSTDLTIYIGSVASSFGGNLPKYWGVVLDNRSGASLVNTAANHAISYTGVYYTST